MAYIELLYIQRCYEGNYKLKMVMVCSFVLTELRFSPGLQA